MRKFSFGATALAATAITLLAASFAQAIPISYMQLNPNQQQQVRLSDLISGQVPGIVVGDKAFDNFQYLFTGDMPDASLINVSAIKVDGNFGIRFQGGFRDLFDPGNHSSDALINFDVQVTDPSKALITDIHLSGNPSLSRPKSDVFNAFAEVVETISGGFGPPLQMYIQSDLNGVVGSAWIDALPSPVARLHVSKDIQLFSVQENGVGTRATISRIDQTFSQQVVPEPASVALFGMALVGLAYADRRRRA